MTDGDQTTFLRRYCKVARRVILKYTDQFSCIASTRVTIDTLRRFGIEVYPQPVKFAVLVKALNKGYTSGLTHAELSKAASAVRVGGVENGWRGHLVAMSPNNTVILDSSFDQADCAFGGALGLQKEVMVFPINRRLQVGRKHTWKAVYEMETDNGTKAEVQYVQLRDTKYRSSPAWNDVGLKYISYEIEDLVRSYPSAVHNPCASR